MFGRILGKILSTPVRLANVPLQAASKAADAMCGKRHTDAVAERDPVGLGEIADAIDRACDR
jgi:hypothetical protein